MKLPCHKKSQYESVATCKMKNGKMKFILPFFIYPDDKKRPQHGSYLVLVDSFQKTEIGEKEEKEEEKKRKKKRKKRGKREKRRGKVQVDLLEIPKVHKGIANVF